MDLEVDAQHPAEPARAGCRQVRSPLPVRLAPDQLGQHRSRERCAGAPGRKLFDIGPANGGRGLAVDDEACLRRIPAQSGRHVRRCLGPDVRPQDLGDVADPIEPPEVADHQLPFVGAAVWTQRSPDLHEVLVGRPGAPVHPALHRVLVNVRHLGEVHHGDLGALAFLVQIGPPAIDAYPVEKVQRGLMRSGEAQAGCSPQG